MGMPRRLSAPAIAPRTEWACQPVARIISATVAPPGRRSSSSRIASLVGDFCDPERDAGSAFGSSARRSLAGATVVRRAPRSLADALRARCFRVLDERDFAMIGLRRLRRGPMPRHRRKPGSPGMTSHDAPFRQQVQSNCARATAARDLRRHRRIDLPSRLLSHQPLCLSQQNGIPPTTSLVLLSRAGSVDAVMPVACMMTASLRAAWAFGVWLRRAVEHRRPVSRHRTLATPHGHAGKPV